MSKIFGEDLVCVLPVWVGQRKAHLACKNCSNYPKRFSVWGPAQLGLIPEKGQLTKLSKCCWSLTWSLYCSAFLLSSSFSIWHSLSFLSRRLLILDWFWRSLRHMTLCTSQSSAANTQRQVLTFYSIVTNNREAERWQWSIDLTPHYVIQVIQKRSSQLISWPDIEEIKPNTLKSHAHTHTHAHPFNGPLSRTIRVSRYQKRKPIWILLKQETVSGSGICWAICKSAPRSRQITMPAPHHSVFYRPDALPAAQPTASKHWRQYTLKSNITKSKWSKLRQKNT